MPRAPAGHRCGGKRPIGGAHRTNSPTSRRRLPLPSHLLADGPFSLRFALTAAPHRPRKRRSHPGPCPRLPAPSHFLAVRPFSLRFALTTAPHRPRKRRTGGASHPAPCPRRRRSRVVDLRQFLALGPFALRYVLAGGASASCRRRKASFSLIDIMGCTFSRASRVYKKAVEGLREVGDLSANQVQADKADAARRGIGDWTNIRSEEVPSYKPKEDLPELFTALTNEEESLVHYYLYGSGHSKERLVLHESSNIEITREKLWCLRPRGWLNDEVINFYLELLKERAKREPTRFLKCHFFNTFFYKKLAGGKTGYDYESVRRWTTLNKLGYALMDCDKIFIPIHRDLHWCLAVINMKEKTYEYLDSFGVMDFDVLRILATYIMDEVKDKSNIELDVSSWQDVSVPLCMQHNGWDCGMFMLKFIDFHSRGVSPSFSQEDMEYFRKRTAKEILRLKAE
ncbi:putative ubiquitin-like-specific protease 1B [Lolium rigidum]|uniref:putative ubiquitin-like-specific protease 1B n=1 Tax=Lolium rigidum TaxID=89674 RepID=UPI001F5C9EAB|nr:putative ubiquitin-like-specific protease 1B [Lolium rigidum]